MRTNSILSIAAAGAMAITAIPASAGPADMAAWNPAAPSASVGPQAAAPLQTGAALPSQQVSPVYHPIKYLSAAVSEMPVPWKTHTARNPTAPPSTPQNDSLSLNTPTPAPTPQILVTTAQLYERQGNVPQARQTYGQAMSMFPGNVEVLRAAARMEDRLGEMAMAETLYRQAVVTNPQHAGALNDLGLCLARQGKLNESLQTLETAVQLQPEKPLYRNNAATVLVEMRQDQRALGHLAAVHGPADANYNMGQLLVQRGRAGDAAPYFQAALQQNPGLDAARVALANLQGQDSTAITTAVSAPVVSAAPAVASTAPLGAPQFPSQQAQQATSQFVTPAGPQFTYPAAGVPSTAGGTTYGQPTYQTPATPSYQYLPPVANSQSGAPRR